VINGRIVVHVYVSVSDAQMLDNPIEGAQLQITGEGVDSMIVETARDGGVSVMLVPGDYRLQTIAPVRWRGQQYSWSIPLSVAEFMPAVDLNEKNATRVEPVIVSGSDARSAERSAATGAAVSAGLELAAFGAGARVDWEGFDDSGARNGFGGEAAAVVGAGRVTIAGGYQHASHSSNLDGEKFEMSGLFLEPRVSLRAWGATVAPYLAGRVGWMREEVAIAGRVVGNGLAYGGGIGVLFGRPTGIRVRASIIALHVSFDNEADTPSFTFKSNGPIVQGALGVSFGLFSYPR
jgi:hypothetical protein